MRIKSKTERGARGTSRGRGRTEADSAADAPLDEIDDSDCEGCEYCATTSEGTE